MPIYNLTKDKIDELNKENDIKKILLLCKKNSAIPVTTYKDYVKIPNDLK